jgi:hypothetical protein
LPNWASSGRGSLTAVPHSDNGEVIMPVRRGAARLAAVLTMLAGLLAVSATPAAADGDTVRVRLPSSFTAGGSPGSFAVLVTRRDGECVAVRTALGIRLPGLTEDQVRVQVAVDGQWHSVAVSGGGDGVVVTARTVPTNPMLCERKSVSVRYRLSFLAGTPGGTVTVVAETYADG